MSFWSKPKAAHVLAAKEEEVREERGKLAVNIVDLERARHRLEELMQTMLKEVDRVHGRHD